uniref:Uncharacterized protein n=1 Tax=Parastrongyloides trichosuri TaxID=131310 RepID=A0A0N5A3P6_PARTI
MRAQSWVTWLSKPINTTNLLSYYIPLTGVGAHSLFTAQLFSPTLLKNIFNEYEYAASRSLMAASLVGSGLFLFYRPHLCKTPTWSRVEYSVLGSVIYNFGSLLLAIFIKPFIPKKSSIALKTTFAFGITTLLASRTLKYLNHIDEKTVIKNEYTFDHLE